MEGGDNWKPRGQKRAPDQRRKRNSGEETAVTKARLHQTPVQRPKPWDNGKKIADILVAAHRNRGRAIKTDEITSKVYTHSNRGKMQPTSPHGREGPGVWQPSLMICELATGCSLTAGLN
ncbi:hypothetical protein QQF64_002239 [Cirrhinus molitorella]|uniref:Uncharacterized protein n=2 Tax=Cirrhinus molitorella TaxID=172907 RepID=A0AA88TAC5_9TELE|nr:hypothetical protein Q8A67_023627 [Cirrhinus molitorella]